LTQSGVSGAFPVASTADAGNVGMYTSGSCAAGYSSLAPGPRLVYRLALDGSTPLGGVLSLSTCGLTSGNTVLYVGTGCPTWFGSFLCLRGNDNAGDVAGQACPSNPLASTLSVALSASRVVFIMAGANDGSDVATGLRWSYAAPSPTRSPSRTSSRARAVSATRSKSRSRKAKRVV
jgi:hypothetical protein